MSAFSPADAIRELAFAWKTLTVYPPGHPAAAGAADEALRQVAGLAAVTGAFVLAVGRDALVIGEERFDGAHGRRFAERLHDLDVGVLRFLDGVRDEELVAFLRLLQPMRKETRSLVERMAEAEIVSITTEPIDFSHLAATDDLEADQVALPDAPRRSLWEKILGQQLSGQGGGPSAESGPRGVLELVNSYLRRAARGGGGETPGDAGGDGREPEATAELAALTARLVEAVGEHTEEAVQAGAIANIKQVAELVGALPRGLREQALDAAMAQLAADSAGGEALEVLGASQQATAMVSSLRRLRAQGRRLAGPAVEWLGGMLRAGAVGVASGAAAQAEQLKLLLAEPDDTPGWGPEALALELPPAELPDLALSSALGEQFARWDRGAGVQELLAILLELIERGETAADAEAVATRLESLLLTLVEGGRVRAAIALVRHLQSRAQGGADDDRAKALRRALERASGATMVALILGQVALAEGDEVRELHELVETLGDRMTRQLLLALCDAEDRLKRRQLLEFLRGGSARVAADARLLLADSRWFVVRNMISLLHAMGGSESIADLRRCLDHADARVRIEALRALGELDRRLPSEIVERLLADADPGVAERMAHIAGHLEGASAVEPLLALVTPMDPFGRQRSLRIKALLALGEIGDPAVLPKVKRYFGTFSVDGIEERRAAFQSLAGYHPAARSEWVDKGLKSRDPEIRATCARLATGGGDG